MPRLPCCCRCSGLPGPAGASLTPSSARPPTRSFATTPPQSLPIVSSLTSSGRSSGPGSRGNRSLVIGESAVGSTLLYTRPFSSTSSPRARHASPDSSSIDLTFPSRPSPDPFEIFHLPRSSSASFTRAEIKSRYLDLVKLYHPDRAVASGEKGKAKEEADERFKLIVAAHELLADPKRREMYVRTGLGWGKTSGFNTGGGGGGAPSPWSQSTAEYHFRRGRPMSSRTRAGAYAYDWASNSDTWSDPYNPHFRPHYHPRGSGMSAGSAESGWKGRGVFGSNALIFLTLAFVTTLVTPLTAWHAATLGDISAPMALVPGEDPSGTGLGEAWAPRVYDGRHRDAAKNLQMARAEAKERGAEKLEAIRRRVQQLQREQAYDRALEIEAVERQHQGTGHLSLPPQPQPQPQSSLPTPKLYPLGGYMPPSGEPPALPRPRPSLPPPSTAPPS
ncbi:hypothetical protein JCM11251_006085 [Rhodosporidiobolus azoricus]